MRFEKGSYLHIYNRVASHRDMVRDDDDRQRLLLTLRYFNDATSGIHTLRNLKQILKRGECKVFEWPPLWPEQKPLTDILAYNIMTNHIHLCVRERQEGGVSEFMRKLGTGMTNYINTKYGESGPVFRGKYRVRVIESDEYVNYLSAYIQIKNSFERYPRGLLSALQNFEDAYQWTIKDPFNSLGEYLNVRNTGIISQDVAKQVFPVPHKYKDFVKYCIGNLNLDELLARWKID